MVLVIGGPGTGKSVIALNLVAALAREGMSSHYATGSAAFTTTLRTIVGAKASSLSARFLRGRRHRTFSLIVAGINCLGIPLGTILGVFTLIVLLRPSVRTLYRIEGG